ncbi:MAG: HD domain-containing protein [Chloroflexota bacterium]|nr:HD domain-containing protein [Chloroflexota bacterium]
MDDGRAPGPQANGSRASGSIAVARSWLDTINRRSGLQRSLRSVFESAHVPRRRVVAVLVVALFAGVYLLGDTAPGIFVVPIVVAAIEFGVVGGLVAALAAVALVLGWDLSKPHADLDALEYLSRAVAYLLLGGLLGRFVTVRRRLDAKIARSEQLSLDLMATASFEGYFTRLNDSWERTLGWSSDELRSRPLIEFVHPDDRERTLIELGNVSAGQNAVSFRNRYRARDGSYRWLEWNACVDTDQAIIHANARDITVLQHAEETIRHHGEQLERTVAERTSELEQSRRETLQRLALAAEYRDDDTHNHTERVGRTSMLIARKFGLPEETVQTICEAVPLHDVGKLGISDAILLKPGPLTAAEYTIMQDHTLIGAAILVDSSSAVLQMAAQIALSHHERWNGSGYPHGVAGEDIPLAARIAAIADTFDAITHTRPYKDARTIDDALAVIRLASGTLFDPAVVSTFLTLDHTQLVHHAYT